jgi:hypothetical protein
LSVFVKRTFFIKKYNLQVLFYFFLHAQIEFVTFQIEFVTFQIEFVTFQIEFVTFKNVKTGVKVMK